MLDFCFPPAFDQVTDRLSALPLVESWEENTGVICCKYVWCISSQFHKHQFLKQVLESVNFRRASFVTMHNSWLWFVNSFFHFTETNPFQMLILNLRNKNKKNKFSVRYLAITPPTFIALNLLCIHNINISPSVIQKTVPACCHNTVKVLILLSC